MADPTPPTDIIEGSIDSDVIMTLVIEDENVSPTTVRCDMTFPGTVPVGYKVHDAILMMYIKDAENNLEFLKEHFIPNNELPVSSNLANDTFSAQVDGVFGGKTVYVDFHAELRHDTNRVANRDIMARSAVESFVALNSDLGYPIVTPLNNDVAQFRNYDGIAFKLEIPDNDVRITTVTEIWAKIVSRDLSFSKVYVLDASYNAFLEYDEETQLYAPITSTQMPQSGENKVFQLPAAGMLQDTTYFIQCKLFVGGSSSPYGPLQPALFTTRVMRVNDAVVTSNNTVNGVDVEFEPPPDSIRLERVVTSYYFMQEIPVFNSTFTAITNFDETDTATDTENGVTLHPNQVFAAVAVDGQGKIQYAYEDAMDSSTVDIDQTIYIIALADGKFGDYATVTVVGGTRQQDPVLTAFQYLEFDGTTEWEDISSYVSGNNDRNYPTFSATVTLGSSPFNSTEGPLYVTDQALRRLDVLAWSTNVNAGILTCTVQVRTDADVTAVLAQSYTDKSPDPELSNTLQVSYIYQRITGGTFDDMLFEINGANLDGTVLTTNGVVVDPCDLIEAEPCEPDIVTTIQLTQGSTTGTQSQEVLTPGATHEFTFSSLDVTQDVSLSQQSSCRDVNDPSKIAYSAFTEVDTAPIPPILDSVIYQETDGAVANFLGTLFCVGSAQLHYIELMYDGVLSTQYVTLDETFSVDLNTLDNITAVGANAIEIRAYTTGGAYQAGRTVNLRNYADSADYRIQTPPTNPTLGAVTQSGANNSTVDVIFQKGTVNVGSNLITEFKVEDLSFGFTTSNIVANPDTATNTAFPFKYTQSIDGCHLDLYFVGRSIVDDYNRATYTLTSLEPYAESDTFDIVVALADAEVSTPQPNRIVAGSLVVTTLLLDVPNYEVSGCLTDGNASLRVTSGGASLTIDNVSSGEQYAVVVTNELNDSYRPSSISSMGNGFVKYLQVSTLEYEIGTTFTVELLSNTEDADLTDSSVQYTAYPYKMLTNTTISIGNKGTWVGDDQTGTFNESILGNQTLITFSTNVWGSFFQTVSFASVDGPNNIMIDFNTVEVLNANFVAERQYGEGNFNAWATSISTNSVVEGVPVFDHFHIVTSTQNYFEASFTVIGTPDLVVEYGTTRGNNDRDGFSQIAFGTKSL